MFGKKINLTISIAYMGDEDKLDFQASLGKTNMHGNSVLVYNNIPYLCYGINVNKKKFEKAINEGEVHKYVIDTIAEISSNLLYSLKEEFSQLRKSNLYPLLKQYSTDSVLEYHTKMVRFAEKIEELQLSYLITSYLAQLGIYIISVEVDDKTLELIKNPDTSREQVYEVLNNKRKEEIEKHKNVKL